MVGTILENLSGKKLIILVSCLLVCQVICFLIGGLIAPIPASVQTIMGTKCKDEPNSFNDTTFWLWTRGDPNCKQFGDDYDNYDTQYANDIVFVFQMPLPRDGRILDYSRWQQNLIGILQTDVAHDSNILLDRHMEITIDARLAYRNKEDPDTEWKYFGSSTVKRTLECESDSMVDEYLYSCSTIPLFELGSLHHDYYLVNIRLPIDTAKQMNTNIGRINQLHLSVIYQNGGFTKIWISLKTVFFPFIVAIMIWFWNRVHLLQRSPVLLEYMLIYLGSALTFLNLPLEYLTLIFDMPYMLLLGDIRQGIFYAMLLSFWLVFSGEHMLIQDNNERNSLKIYWKHLSAVVIGCTSLFVFDVCERGAQLKNPFYSIWVSNFGAKIAMGFIILAAISAIAYFIFLSYMIWKVFCNISIKRSSLPTMSVARRLHYEGIIYRFKFLMLATILCAALTITGFIMGQIAEGKWKWDEDIELEFTSAFFTGVYGMWNIYIFALIVLYAPSHKQWKTDTLNENINSEEIEFNNLPSDNNPSEISSLTSFARKAAFD